jgi:ketosteroid isomerase-like protein
MSEENVEIVRQAYEALARRDWDALFADAHPDFVVQTQLQGSFRGRDEAQRFIEDEIGAFQTWTAEPVEFFDGEDRVVVFVTNRAQPSGSSAEIEITIGHLWTLRNGAVLSLETFPKRHDALEAAGLSE